MPIHQSVVLDVHCPKNPTGERVASLLVEASESTTYYKDSTVVCEAFRKLTYRIISTKTGGPPHDGYWFQARYRGSGQHGTVDLVCGSVMLYLEGLEGHRIGTFLFDDLVSWAKQWPQANVLTINLGPGQADEDNKERRNRFYERFNIGFNYADPPHNNTGSSKPMTVAALEQVHSWRENIHVVPPFERLRDTEQQLVDLKWEARLRAGEYQQLAKQHEQALSTQIKRRWFWLFKGS